MAANCLFFLKHIIFSGELHICIKLKLNSYLEFFLYFCHKFKNKDYNLTEKSTDSNHTIKPFKYKDE